MNEISIDEDRCNTDGMCAQVCPAGVFEHESNRPAQVTEPEACIACGQCAAICPTHAVQHEAFPAEKVPEINRELQPSFEQVREALRSRRSRRDFTDEPVDRDLIEEVLDAAELAPTAVNCRSTEYIVVQEAETLQEIVRLTGAYLGKIAGQLKNPVTRFFLKTVGGREVLGAIEGREKLASAAREVEEGNDIILHGAPVLILMYADRSAPFAGPNANLAQQNATLAAEALGLANFYTGFVVSACERDRRIPDLLDIPKTHQVYAGMALGHAKHQFRRWIDRGKPEVRWV